MTTIHRRTLLAGGATLLAAPALIGRARATTALKVSTSLLQRSEVLHRPHLVRPVRAAAEGGDEGRGDDGVLPRQPVGAGSGHRQPAQGRGGRHHAGRHLDLEQCRSGIRRVRSRLRVRRLRPHAARRRDAGRGGVAGAAGAEGGGASSACGRNLGARNFLTKFKFSDPARSRRSQDPLPAESVVTETVKLMGAAATPMAFGEIYTALQAGVIDGLEHDAPTILSVQVLTRRQKSSP